MIVKPSCPPDGSNCIRNTCQWRLSFLLRSRREGPEGENTGFSRHSHGRGSAPPAAPNANAGPNPAAPNNVNKSNRGGARPPAPLPPPQPLSPHTQTPHPQL